MKLDKIDYILNKVIPKKLLVWVVFFVCFMVDKVDSTQFTSVTIGYISANLLSKWAPYVQKKIDSLKNKPSI